MQERVTYFNCRTLVNVAAYKGCLAVVEYLCEENIDINIEDNDGATPSYIAAAKGHLAVVAYLCEAKQVCFPLIFY